MLFKVNSSIPIRKMVPGFCKQLNYCTSESHFYFYITKYKYDIIYNDYFATCLILDGRNGSIYIIEKIHA